MVKEMMMQGAEKDDEMTDKSIQDIVKNTKGVVFYSTPHHGSWLASASWNLLYIRGLKDIVDVLKRNDFPVIVPLSLRPARHWPLRLQPPCPRPLPCTRSPAPHPLRTRGAPTPRHAITRPHPTPSGEPTASPLSPAPASAAPSRAAPT